MQQERDKNKRDCCCKLITQTVKAFFDCLRFRFRHSSSSSDMVKSKARNEEEEEAEASSVETSTRSLNVASKRRRKQPVSSGKRGGVNDYDM
ncbi:unnamed protein product [Arabis nemorensis]|uniref:Uncharacterized protein n=1 Tax=Arabis nemorensis TaxID=586526 RepID=A0A565CK46_9BRAS|nr:unnamed protein product [Arabis nemorensis]